MYDTIWYVLILGSGTRDLIRLNIPLVISLAMEDLRLRNCSNNKRSCVQDTDTGQKPMPSP